MSSKPLGSHEIDDGTENSPDTANRPPDIGGPTRKFTAAAIGIEQYRQIVDTAQEGIWLRDANGHTTYVNRRMAEMLGFTPDEMLGRPVYDFMDADAQADAEMRFARRRRGECQQHDVRYRHKDGRDVWTIVSASPLYNDAGAFDGVLGMVTNITERKRQEESMTWLARHDPLTELPNRALFEERLQHLIAMATVQDSSAAVMFIDLNQFKHVNDTLGHAIGDQLLRIVAARIVGCLRAEDTVARVGGDEFTVMLPGVRSPEDAANVADKILATLAMPIIIDGRKLYTSGSIGISMAPTDGLDVHSVLKHADVAMYQAKERGGGHCMFTQSMDAHAMEQLAMETGIRSVLDRDELYVLYQPQIDAYTGEVCAYEAICRWRHPLLGIIESKEYAEYAESTGMIVPMGTWMLQSICRQIGSWASAGSAVHVSIDLFGRQMNYPGFNEMVRSCLDQNNINAHWLEIEVTEGEFAANPTAICNVLSELRAMGIGITLDEFGTGRSPLSSLRLFRFDALKIHRSITAAVVTDETSRAIVKSIVHLATDLGLQVIADATDTVEQRDILAAVGCHRMQGDLFSAHDLPKSNQLGGASRRPYRSLSTVPTSI